MSRRYLGGLLSTSSPAASSSAASGLWTLQQHFVQKGQVAWTSDFTFTNTLLNTYNFTGSTFSFAMPSSGVILVDAYGAQGGTGSNDSGAIYAGALGGRIQAYIQVAPGTTIYGLIGGQGSSGSSRGGGGGGGFTALWTGNSDPGLGTWLIGAGGGGGSGAQGSSGDVLAAATGGGITTTTQANSRTNGSGGAGGNGGGPGANGSTSGGGTGGSGNCDCSGGGGTSSTGQGSTLDKKQ